MDAIELLRQSFDDLHKAVREDIAEVEPGWLWWQPGARLNHIGFLYWHLVRDEDTVLSHLAGEPEIWQAKGWHARLDMDGDAQGTGLEPAALAAFRYDLPAFEGYRDRAWEATAGRLARIDPAGLSAAAWPGSSWSVAQQLVEGCLCHSWLHLGEIRAVMGLQGWRFRE